jgi:phosphatidylserine decarboxylase
VFPFLFRLTTELSSQPIIARLVGKFAKSSLSKPLIPRFATLYGIPLDEASKAVDQYVSLNDFFIRQLREGARSIHPDSDAIVSPVDGTLVAVGEISNDHAFVVKGQTYTVDGLLNDSVYVSRFRKGTFAVIYLSPSNYHRIHSPVAGRLIAFERIPGKVYPVNDRGMRLMPRVLSRNARLISYITVEDKTMALVKVGAMNVSSIRYSTGDQPPTNVMKGDELAYFEFGSTVVLLWEQGMFQPSDHLCAGLPLRMGEKIGNDFVARS